jgi:hypothetical protein
MARSAGSQARKRSADDLSESEAPLSEALDPTRFWQSVRELAAMRGHIPEERREMSAARGAIRSDVRAKKWS